MFETPHFRDKTVNPGYSGYNQVWGPSYHMWRHSKLWNEYSMLRNIQVNSWHFRVGLQSEGILLRRKLGYFWCIFHRLISTTPVSLSPGCSCVSRDTVSLFVVSTIVRKGRRDSLLTLHEPCGGGFNWRLLRYPSWKRGDSGAAIRESWEGCGVSQVETGWCDSVNVLWPVFI